MTRLRRIATGIGALMVLTALAGGVPYALCRFIGWPLPHRLPSLSALGHDLDQHGIPDRTLVDALAVLVWLTWGVLVASLLAEVPAAVRGTRAARLPLAGIFQPVTGRLVAAVLVAALAMAPRPTPARTSTAPALVTLARGPVTSSVLADTIVYATPAAADDLTPVPPRRAPTAASRSVATRSYVVQRGDTLWGIAERELRDPLRWREIAELNADRSESTGRFTDPHWIYPGWTLLLPIDASSVTGHAPSAPSTSTRSGRRRTTSPTPTTGSHRRASAPPTSAPPASGVTSTSNRRVAASNPAAQPARPTAPRDANGTPASPVRETQSPQRPARAPLAPIGVGLLGVGLLGLLAGLRRVQQRHRRVGRRIALPTGALTEVERALDAGADRAAAAVVDRAIRLFGRVCRDLEEVPIVLGLLLSRDAVEFLLLDAPSFAPEPFTNSEAHRWRLDRHDPSVELALLGAAADASLLPCLVTIGEDEEGIVLLNLESGGSVAIAGDQTVAAEVATAVALELSSSSWVERVELYDVGVGTEQANPLRCTTVAALADALEAVASHRDAMAGALAVSRWTSASTARLAAPSEDWSPLVVVSNTAPSINDAAALALVEEPERHGLALLAPGNFAARWTLTARPDGTLEVPVLGRSVLAQRVSPRHLAGIAALLGLAASQADVAPDEAPYDAISDGEVSVDAEPAETEFDEGSVPHEGATEDEGVGAMSLETPALFADSDLSPSTQVREPSHHDIRAVKTSTDIPVAQVEVSVLGALKFKGLTRDLNRRKATQLLVWLALHPHGGSADTVVTAVWPKGDCSDHTFWNYRWEVKRALGDSATTGAPLLPTRGDLVLGPEVTTDWARFRALASRADRAGRAAALALVRGRPFGNEDWVWLTTEGFVAAIEAEVADVAYALGEEELERRDYDAAAQAAEQGILISPYDERLYGILMKAADGAGNPAGVRAVMHRLSAALEDDIEPLETVHPETSALYASLVRRTPRPLEAPPSPSRSKNA